MVALTPSNPLARTDLAVSALPTAPVVADRQPALRLQAARGLRRLASRLAPEPAPPVRPAYTD
jgi:hypothetical protein